MEENNIQRNEPKRWLLRVGLDRPSRFVLRITAICLALAGLCFFLPYGVMLTLMAFDTSNAMPAGISVNIFLMTLGSSFVFMGAAFVGFHYLTRDRSIYQTATTAVGIYGCATVIAGLGMEIFGNYIANLDEHLATSGFTAVGLWMFLLNRRTWQTMLWPRPLSGLGIAASIPLLLFPILNYYNVRSLGVFLVGLPPIYFIAMSAYLFLRDVQGRPLGEDTP